VTNAEGLYLTGGFLSLGAVWFSSTYYHTKGWGPICAAILAAGFFLGAALLLAARRRGS
jgi:hypothetical protein